MEIPKTVIPANPVYPFDPNVGMYNIQFGILQPYEFTGWQDETMSWKQTCYITAGLYGNPTMRIKGPDCIKLLSDCTTNSHARFAVGRAKHTVLTDDQGFVLTHGIALRVDEEEVWTYSLAPWINYAATKGNYDVQFEDYTFLEFNFQCGGPRVLEMLEAATGDDLHDIKFMGHRMSSINGKPVRVIRMGMAGTLAYEVHGSIEDAHELYEKIVEVGQEYGVRRVGWHTYSNNHAENGFPQEAFHFPGASREDPKFLAYLEGLGYNIHFWPGKAVLCGSGSRDIKTRYKNPVELNWQNSISFDHDFPGKAVIEKLYNNPKRKTMSLIWNVDDLLEVYKSQFEKDEPYRYMEFPLDPVHLTTQGGNRIFQDDVFDKDGNHIGCSMGREYSRHARAMFSLGVIDIKNAELGTEVYVLWGEPGGKQMKIRAKVDVFPILSKSMTMNVNYDVETIPHINSK